ncbi:Clavaminate synthase-like protein [Auricularia subglabra TFB-10046 SS5]|nr:Clavaminate synthase-like protein [Auricularia subglabra TFB-10046 SS5]
MSSGTDFTAIPILDYNDLRTDRAAFMKELQNALINVGFLYLRNPPVDTEEAVAQLPRFFDLPEEDKQRVGMINSPHFLGYTAVGSEYTRGQLDIREQFDWATPLESTWKEGDPDFLRLWGPSQWPPEETIPGFRAAMEKFLLDTDQLAHEFTSLVSEALGLAPEKLYEFFEPPGQIQHRGKMIKYPEVREGGSDQGCGAHYDSGFLAFLVQVTDHFPALQVQNAKGDWINAPRIPNTMVINIGIGLQFLTSGVALATSHRVVSPKPGTGTRYSLPYFQQITQRTVLGEAARSLTFPPEILAMRDARGKPVSDSINYPEYGHLPAGLAALIGRNKSHRDVGAKWYPTLYKELFPDAETKAETN